MLAYFEIFQFPLTQNELKICLPSSQCSDFNRYLNELVGLGYILNKDEYYSISAKSLSNNQRPNISAELNKTMAKAVRNAKLISKFPFVRAVCLSGSLSKGWVDKDTDVDYFIISQPGRLWISRTLLILYKKLFLLNSRKFFCLNYFIDSENLSIPDQNVFTATEIAFLKPVINDQLYDKFIATNPWILNYYPGWINEHRTNLHPLKNNLFKKLMEFFMSGWLGNSLDSVFFKITLRRWKKKFNNISDNEFELNFRSRENVSKHHPRGFQGRVLKQFTDKLEGYYREHKLAE